MIGNQSPLPLIYLTSTALT